MFKIFRKIQYILAILAIPLSLVSMNAYAMYPHCSTPATNGAKGLTSQVCDVTFTVIPTFTNLCTLGLQTGLYTIRNNTPVPIKINYIRIQNNDGGPNASAAISTAPTNNCVSGSILASGASCNIQVTLVPTALGTFNRVLQVGIDTRQVELDGPPITAAVNCSSGSFPSTTPFGFTIPITCTILGATTVTNVPSVGTRVNGDVCTCPGTSITGFPPGVLTGILRLADGPACAQYADELTTFTTRGALPCGTTFAPGTVLGTGGTVPTLTPGVYCFSPSAQITGALTLNGAGDYTFITPASTLTTSSNSSILLTGGAARDHVFWIVGSSATLGTGTQFQGNVLASASITFNTNANLKGRAWVNTAAITMDTNVVNPDPTLPLRK